MNTTRQLLAVLFGATIGFGAFAQEATPDTWMNAVASKSRDTVRQELRQAHEDGSIKSTAEVYSFDRIGSTKSREQVRAELIAAKGNGSFQALNADVHAFDMPRERLVVEARLGR